MILDIYNISTTQWRNQGRERELVNVERDSKLQTIRQLPELHHYTISTFVSEKEVNLT